MGGPDCAKLHPTVTKIQSPLANLLLDAVQQCPVGFVGSGEGHHGEQLGLLADDTLLRRNPSH